MSAVVGGTAAAVVTKLGGPNDDPREHERSSSSPAPTMSARVTPAEVASNAPPAVPPAPPAPPTTPQPSLWDLLDAFEWGAPVDISATPEAPAPQRADVADVDAGVAVVAREPDPRSQKDSGTPNATTSTAPTFAEAAHRFVTEAPPWAASAWTSDPNAGAGPFITSTYSSSTTPDPQAGAGPFLTEQKTPGAGFVVFPRLFLFRFPGSNDDGDSVGTDGIAGNEDFGGVEANDVGESAGAEAFEPFELPLP